MKILRKIITIDENLCNGCGQCVSACAEGALQIINGKIKVAEDRYCDGLGACIGECPEGALTIIEREAEEFDEAAVEQHLSKTHKISESKTDLSINESMLLNWPIKIRLIPEKALFLRESRLLIAADCCAAAFPDLHSNLLKGKILMMGCPKFDDIKAYVDKFSEIFKNANLKSITIVNMEVPCCSALFVAVKKAYELSGKNIPIERIVIGVKGKIIKSEQIIK